VAFFKETAGPFAEYSRLAVRLSLEASDRVHAFLALETRCRAGLFREAESAFFLIILDR